MRNTFIGSLKAAGLAVALLAAHGAIAQSADPSQPAAPAGEVSPGVDPGTTALNDKVEHHLQRQSAKGAAARALYAEDLAAYDAKMKSVRAADGRYRANRKAYATAMATWRRELAACNADAAGCPTRPDPATF